MFAEMRERQRTKQEGGAAGVVSPVVTKRAADFTWGKPLPRRGRKDLKAIQLMHRRKKHPPKPKTQPKWLI